MSRICPHCGTANEERALYCGACATQLLTPGTSLVRAGSKSALPILSARDKATLGSVAVGLAAIALRVGAAVLQQVAEKREERPKAIVRATPVEPSATVRVRRRWVVGDRNGPVRWGEEEFEIDDNRDKPGPYRITFG